MLLAAGCFCIEDISQVLLMPILLPAWLLLAALQPIEHVDVQMQGSAQKQHDVPE